METSGNIIIIEAEDNFKRVHKSIIENKNIDCETLGIYTRIIVLGLKWKLNIKGLSTHLGVSDTRIRKSISVLEQEGYIVRTAVRGEGGKFFGWDYKILPTPIEESKRSSAGKPTSQKTDTRFDGQVGEPTTRLTDNTVNWEDNNNKLKESIDLNNNNKEDTNVSKKNEIDYESVFVAWNNIADNIESISKVKSFTEGRKKQIKSLISKCNTSIDEIVKLINTIPYADDWVLGKGGKDWVINFDFLTKNTSNWYVRALEGDMHKKNRYEFDKIMNGECLSLHKENSDTPKFQF